MTSNPTEFTAAIAERTVVVTWPDNDRGGATPPPDGWQDRAWEQESTLHEIDEGSVSGCSVLRWRNDPRSDAELIAASLALVTGKAAAVPAVFPEPPSRAESVCICGHPERQHFEDVCITEITGCHCGDFLPVGAAAEEIARLRQIVRQKPPSRAAVLLWAADALDESERLRDLTDDHMHDVHAAADELRRLAAEAQQQPETEAPTLAQLVEADAEYRDLLVRRGRELAAPVQPATVNSSAPLWSEETRCVCGHLPGIHTGAVRFCAVPECDCASYAPPV